MYPNETNFTPSFVVIGSRKVGKTHILNKVCGPGKNNQYSIAFSNYKLNFTELCYQDSTPDLFYHNQHSYFQQNAIIIIVYSKIDNESYDFAKQIYDLVKDESKSIFFIETYQDCDDKLLRDFIFEKDIDNRVFACSKDNSRDYLLSIFVYIYFTFQNSIYSPIINICFPKHDVRNLVATSEINNRTFILTHKSIKMYSNDPDSQANSFINFQFSNEFTFYHPISLISNYDGTKLILITAFKFYLIDKSHSNFDPSAYFLPDIHRITPVELYHADMNNKQVIDVQFFPLLNDFFAVVFPDVIQIFRIKEEIEVGKSCIEKIKDINCSLFEGQDKIKMFRFRPIFDDMPASDLFSIYYLTNTGRIYSIFLKSIDDNLKSISKKKIQEKEIQAKYDNKSKKIILYFDYHNDQSKFISINIDYAPMNLLAFNFRNMSTDANNPILIHGFDFIKNEIIIYLSFGSLNQTFFHSTLKSKKVLLDSFTDNPFSQINGVEGLFRINENLFVKTKESLYVFAFDENELFIHQAINSKDIVGFTNSPYSCIIAPGYIVNLSFYFTRVNPILTHTYSSKELMQEYNIFMKKRNDYFNQIKNETDEVVHVSKAINDETTKLKTKQDEINKKILDIGEKLEKLEQDARRIMDQLDEIRSIQPKDVNQENSNHNS